MKPILKGIKVYKLGHGGIGIGSMPDGKKVLIKGGALPGSIVDVKVVKRRKDFIEAHIMHTKKYDPHFADGEIFCPHYFIPQGVSEVNAGTAKIGCGGCKWQMMSYERQLELKHHLVEESFRKITKNYPLHFLPIIGSPVTQGYRNKIEFSFGVYKQQTTEYREWEKQYNKERHRSGTCPHSSEAIASEANHQTSPFPQVDKYLINNEWGCGFHKQGEFSKIVDVDSCGLISEKANQIFQQIKKLCFKSGLPVYDQKTHQGFFRHLVIREGVNTGQLMVNLSVCLANLNKEQTNIWEDLLGKFKQENYLTEQITTFVITNNTGLADTVKNETSEMKVFWGDGYIHETLNFDEVSYITFRISPFSFFQTNTHGAEKLFSTAFAMLGNWEGNILDLYCGTGSIGLSLLKIRKNLKSDQALIGIEIVEDAIRDARMNAKINGLEDQTFFIASPAEKALENAPELTEKIKNLGVVVIDPPREGLHNNVIEWIANLKKESDFKLLYISCNPVTMARDVELFLERGFVLKEIQPVDMFGHTHHIECVGVLE